MSNEELQPLKKLSDYLIWIKEKLMTATTEQISQYKKQCETYGFNDGLEIVEQVMKERFERKDEIPLPGVEDEPPLTEEENESE